MLDEENYTGDHSLEMRELPVHEQEQAGASLPSAEEIRATVTPHRKTQNKALILLIVGSVALLALIIGLPVGLNHRNSSGGYESSNVEGSQGVVSRKATVAQVIQYLLDNRISSSNDISRANSPQSKAIVWIAETDGMNLQVPQYWDASYVERYVLALIYFATGGDTWMYQMNWLSGRDVCEWNGILQNLNNLQVFYVGILCDTQTGDLEALYLGT